MEYGILVAEDGNGLYQIIGSVWSLNEARELADEYIAHGPEFDYLAPDRFIINRRGTIGGYTVREEFAI